MKTFLLVMKFCSIVDPNLCTNERFEIGPGQNSGNLCVMQAARAYTISGLSDEWVLKTWECVQQENL